MAAELELQHSRTLLLPELELSQLESMQAAEVWVIGLGGLGAAASLYLASSGVRRLHLVDGDQIDITNLPRQVLYGLDDIGRSKAEVAAERLSQLNPNALVTAHSRMADEDWLEQALAGASLVLDCTDRFASRHAINRICASQKIPLVIASVVRWEGQLMVCAPSLGAQGCYACAFPATEPSGSVDAACGAFGVFPTMAGVMATLQAQEALKVLLGYAPEPDLLMLQGPALELIRIQRRRALTCSVCQRG